MNDFLTVFPLFFVPELSYVVDDVDVEDVVDALVLQNQSGRRRSLTCSGVDQASVEVLAVCLQTIFLHQFFLPAMSEILVAMVGVNVVVVVVVEVVLTVVGNDETVKLGEVSLLRALSVSYNTRMNQGNWRVATYKVTSVDICTY